MKMHWSNFRTSPPFRMSLDFSKQFMVLPHAAKKRWFKGVPVLHGLSKQSNLNVQKEDQEMMINVWILGYPISRKKKKRHPVEGMVDMVNSLLPCSKWMGIPWDTHIKLGIPHSIYWLITVKINGYLPLTVPVCSGDAPEVGSNWIPTPLEYIEVFVAYPPSKWPWKKTTYLLAFSAGCFLHIFLSIAWMAWIDIYVGDIRMRKSGLSTFKRRTDLCCNAHGQSILDTLQKMTNSKLVS